MVVHCTHRAKQVKAEKLRREEEKRIKIEELKQALFRRREEAKRRIPKAPPPPPVVEMAPLDMDLMDDDEEPENIVLDVGMHTVKVRMEVVVLGGLHRVMHLSHVHTRLVWPARMLLKVSSELLLVDQGIRWV